MSTGNIIKWCDKHTYLVELLKQNLEIFLANEIPKSNLNFDEIKSVESNNVCVSKLMDKYLFILAMMSPSSIYNLLTDKIGKLRVTMNNLLGLKKNNNDQVCYMLDMLDDRFIQLYLK